ncbi:MAG: toll/interleukin-1 receptor domain-containing protein [Ignavibacteriales bacterium]|nr:toll/interleukin-1 receptor domain-containing protein [Ignavibacteriales bacterium]
MKIFINYRREDEANLAFTISKSLKSEFGGDNVFFDREEIPFGSEFPKEIDRALQNCLVFLPIIGRNWLNLLNRRQLLNEKDFVLDEIYHALNKGIVVIPVLIDDTIMPSKNEIPENVQNLSERQAINISSDPKRLPLDIKILVNELKKAFPKLPADYNNYSDRNNEQVELDYFLNREVYFNNKILRYESFFNIALVKFKNQGLNVDGPKCIKNYDNYIIRYEVTGNSAGKMWDTNIDFEVNSRTGFFKSKSELATVLNNLLDKDSRENIGKSTDGLIKSNKLDNPSIELDFFLNREIQIKGKLIRYKQLIDIFIESNKSRGLNVEGPKCTPKYENYQIRYTVKGTDIYNKVWDTNVDFEVNRKTNFFKPVSELAKSIDHLVDDPKFIENIKDKNSSLGISKPHELRGPKNTLEATNKQNQDGIYNSYIDVPDPKSDNGFSFDVELKLLDKSLHKLTSIECGYMLKSNIAFLNNQKSKTIRNLHYFPLNTFYGILFLSFDKMNSMSLFTNNVIKKTDLSAEISDKLLKNEYFNVKLVDGTQIITGPISGNRDLKIFGKDDFGEAEILVNQVKELVFTNWSKTVNPFVLPDVKITDKKFVVRAYKMLSDDLAKFGYKYLVDAIGEEFVLNKIIGFGWLNSDNTFKVSKINIDNCQYHLDFEKLEYLKTDGEIAQDGRWFPKMHIELKYKNGAIRKSDFGWGNSAILGISEYGIALVELKNMLIVEAIE